MPITLKVRKKNYNFFFEELEKFKIDTRFVQKVDSCSTARSSILIDQNKDNCIVVDSGANHRIDFEKFRSSFEEYQNSLDNLNFTIDIILQVEMKKEQIFEFLKFFNSLESSEKELKVQIFGDVNWPEILLDKEIGNNFTLINPNEVEFEDMLESAKKSGKSLILKLPLVIAKQGSKGASIIHDVENFPGESEMTHVASITSQENFKEKIKEMKIVDPTGAGDAFFAYLVGEFIKRGIKNELSSDNIEKLKEAILVANCAGFLTCTKMGACVPPSMDEIKAIISP